MDYILKDTQISLGQNIGSSPCTVVDYTAPIDNQELVRVVLFIGGDASSQLSGTPDAVLEMVGGIDGRFINQVAQTLPNGILKTRFTLVEQFLEPGDQLIVTLKSDQSADSSVEITAKIYASSIVDAVAARLRTNRIYAAREG